MRNCIEELSKLRADIVALSSPPALKKHEILRFDEAHQLKLQAEAEASEAPTIADLFCGAGGLSLGFTQAGFRVCLASDLDPLSCDTWRFNHPNVAKSRIVVGDIGATLATLPKIAMCKPDVLAGGPPCQGYSHANRHHQSPIEDPRNVLYRDFVRAAELLRPKFIVMENVRGMHRVADSVCQDFERLTFKVSGRTSSYKVACQILNAYDFGAAQSRERLIFLGVRKDVTDAVGVTPEVLFEDIKAFCTRANYRFVLANALKHLRPLAAPHKMHVGEIDTDEGGRKVDVNPFRGDESAYLRHINLSRTVPFIYNHKARYCSLLNHEIYASMNQGDDGTSPAIADIFPYKRRNGIFKDKYFRLYADRPSRTITAHMRSDCHSHIHPTQPRGLTPREAARAQSFPDDYAFLGPYLKTYIQIGNAVPPVMARGIANAIKPYLKELQR